MKTSILLISLIALINAPLSQAEEGKQRGKMTRALDTDGDKALSFEEFQNGPDKRFEEADANNDGLLTLDEMRQKHADRVAKREAERQARASERLEEIGEDFADLDADGSGDISKEEAQRGIFDKLDQDGDGFITKREAKKARHQRRNHHGREGRHERGEG